MVFPKPIHGNEDGGIRESDLPNSIKNEKEKLEAENEDAEEELSVEYPPEGFDVEDDFQLKRAIEILKTGSYTQLLASAKG